jgi:hypothetical protein
MLEIHVVAVCQLQFIPVLRVMTVKTPALFCGMLELDVCVLVFQHSPLGIRLHAGVTVRTREDTFSERRAGHRKVLLLGFSVKGQTKPHEGDKKAQNQDAPHYTPFLTQMRLRTLYVSDLQKATNPLSSGKRVSSTCTILLTRGDICFIVQNHARIC